MFKNIIGFCHLKHFQIFTNPGTYILKPVIENYSNIKLKFDDIELKIKNCNENQIVMKDKYDIQYCEKPKCHESCPVNSTATCLAYNSKSVNNKSLNICKCLPGWTGENCDIKIYIDFRYIINLINK